MVTTPSTALSGEKAARQRHCAATYPPHDSCGTDTADFLEELATSHTATSGFTGKLYARGFRGFRRDGECRQRSPVRGERQVAQCRRRAVADGQRQHCALTPTRHLEEPHSGELSERRRATKADRGATHGQQRAVGRPRELCDGQPETTVAFKQNLGTAELDVLNGHCTAARVRGRRSATNPLNHAVLLPSADDAVTAAVKDARQHTVFRRR